MKAKDLVKKELSIDEIYLRIKEENNYGYFKHHIPHWIYVSDETKNKLIDDGFKVYKGSWDGMMNDCCIIEW